MKRLKICALFLLLLFGASVTTAPNLYADDESVCGITGYSDPLLCGKEGSDEEQELLGKVRSVLSTVYIWVSIVAIIFIVIGGINYMLSGGNKEKIKTSRYTIIYSICGLIVTLSAFALTSLVIGSLEGRTNGSVALETDSGDPFGADRKKGKAIDAINHTTIIAGQTITIKAKVVPDYAENRTISFKSSDPSIASVNEHGTVKAKREGKVKIIASTKDGLKKEISITVQKPIPVTSISVSMSEVKLKKGKSVTVEAKPFPQNASDKTLTWASENPKVATVDQMGTIKAINSGETTYVTVTAQNKQVFALNKSPNTITLADAKVVDEQKKVQAKIKVIVESEYYACQGATDSKTFSGHLDFRPVTKKFVTPHITDFFSSNYSSAITAQGGYTSYVKKLSGIFTQLAGKDKKVKVKSACDFQAAAEYTYGLMTIWGFDYDNRSHYHRWGEDGGGGQSDGYYYGSGSRYVGAGYSDDMIDIILSDGKPVRTNCNAACDTLIKKTDLAHTPCDQYGPTASKSKVGKITNTSELRVGDLVHFFHGGSWGHVAVVGEVYKDYLVIYDGGRRFIGSKQFKYKVRRGGFNAMVSGDSAYSNYNNWYGVRLWDIDQSKTLEGLK